MGKGTFLANPELSKDDVLFSATSEMGVRAGQPFPCPGNSGLLKLSAIGDSGDAMDHQFTIRGTQTRPCYAPHDVDDNELLYCAPRTATATPPTGLAATTHRFAMVACDDRLYLIMAESAAPANLYIRRWTGPTGWQLLLTQPITDATGGISVCADGADIYIAVTNNTDLVIEIYRFNAPSNTLSTVDEAAVAVTDATTVATSIATNGANFVLLLTRTAGSFKDVDVYYGGLNDLELRTNSINDTFATLWTTGGDVRCGTLTYNKAYGFLAAFRVGTGATPRVRLATSTDGETWIEFKGADGKTVRQPSNTVAVATHSNTPVMAVVVENYRVYVFRATAAATDGVITGMKMLNFIEPSNVANNKPPAWVTEVDVTIGVPPLNTTRFAACIWRGSIYMTYLSDQLLVTVVRVNGIGRNPTGYMRELRLGEPMYIAGNEDDTGTALFITASGTIPTSKVGDRFIVPASEYDYRIDHTLDDFMQRTWRGENDTEQHLVYDAGEGRAFEIDTIAIFGCNFARVVVEMDDDLSFLTPAISQQVLSVVAFEPLLDANRNTLYFAPGTFEPHAFATALARYWAVLPDGDITAILDNDDSSLKVNTDTTGQLGTVYVFRNSMGFMWPTKIGPYRYLRLRTPITKVPDGYVEISRVLFGLRFEPPIDYRIGWKRRYGQAGSRVELRNGARLNTLLNHIQRPAWDLTFRHEIENVRPVANFFGRAAGGTRLVAFWPDPSATGGVAWGGMAGDQPEVFPMFFDTEPPEMTDLGVGVAELAVTLEGQI